MTHSQDSAGTDSPAEFRRLIVQLGIAMVAAGDAVDIIEQSLRRVVAAHGVAGLQIALLPTSLFVQTGTGDSGSSAPRSRHRCGWTRSTPSIAWSNNSNEPS